MSFRVARLAALLILAGAAATARAQTAPPPVAHELRAVWVATVDNMDWPSKAGLSAAEQQAELVAILDRLVQLRMNAIVLQVRPAADALYQSDLEPWSEVLTGEMGRAPGYDPLAFAVTEAHKRGLELHAWINPYRARYSLTRPASSNHVSRTNPELIRRYGPYLWMDPGDARVRDLTTRVVLDIVRRYDIDALHIDDYFYPYREVVRGRELPFPDDATWERYRRGGGTLARDDWRRENVNLLVRQLNDAIHNVKPWVRFGVSPFGIWRPGYPSSVRGLDQYTEIYADARKWLRQGWADYFTPQLYWSVDKPEQRYDHLLKWWVDENVMRRHMWPGNYTGKMLLPSFRWPAKEIIEQIRLTRAQPGAMGNVHFSMKVFFDNPDGLNERLVAGPYAQPALVPATSWLSVGTPPAPAVSVRKDATGRAMLEMLPTAQSPVPIGYGGTSTVSATPWLWLVQTLGESGWATEIVPAAVRSRPLGSRGVTPREVRVTAIDRLGVASPAAVLRAPF
ncbi:MAG TPA: family 10 glycosylhydrolase [Gemmatimonadaceae bacterium]|nr:family 10 glycosylhydrolase [Gemmatimonadaceae bacterium]